MASYRWTLQTFRITDTRSHHDDTLIAGLAVSVNSVLYPPICAQMGDFNNGDHSFAQHGLKSLDINANSDDAVQMIYQIYNNGNQKKPNLADLTAALTKDLDTINQARLVSLARVEAASKKPVTTNTGAALKPLDDELGALGEVSEVGLNPPQGEVVQLVNEPGAFWYDLFTGGLYTLFQ